MARCFEVEVTSQGRTIDEALANLQDTYLTSCLFGIEFGMCVDKFDITWVANINQPTEIP